MAGPLDGIRIVEFAGIGPGPFCGMMLADHGAQVIRIDRASKSGSDVMPDAAKDVLARGRQSIALNLKSEEGIALARKLCASADGLIEGFRPGVMERLGLGPAEVHARNPKLVYGRMTGYGQEGPMSQVAGHDINYISLAGALGASARQGERPMFALNLVGDYGGGAMFLVMGVLAGIIEARTSGKGQVVDAAMVDGAAALTSMFHGMRAAQFWKDEAGTNLLDSGAHFYEVYATSDGGHVALGAIEPQFYARLLELLEIPAEEMPQWETDRWPEFKERLTALFATRTRAEWSALLEPEETCATGIYGLGEAPEHPHMQARGSFTELKGMTQPQAAPRFDRTPSAAREPIADGDAVLDTWGIDSDRRAALREAGALQG